MNIISDRELYIKKYPSITIKLSELMYFLAFAIYLIFIMIDTTMFRVYLNYKLATLISVGMSGIVILKIILFDKYSKKQMILPAMLFIVCILAYLKSGYQNLFYLPIFTIGAKNIDFKKICKVYLFLGISIVIISYIAVNLNIIEHIIYIRDGKARYSFGSVYATDFAARVFFLCVTYCYVKYDKLNIKDAIIFAVIGILVFIFCDARLDSISIFMLSILALINKKIYENKVRIEKNIKGPLTLAIPFFAIFSIILSYIYNPESQLMIFINKIFSNRLSLGKRGIDNYGFTLFGQQIDMIGAGGINGGVTNYFFIDCSYLFIALRYGLILLVVICAYYFLFIKNRIEEKDLLLPILLVIIGINSIVAHHFIDIAYHPFTLILFANMYNQGNQNRELK